MSNRDAWETPTEFFDILDREYHFTLDVAATEANRKCQRFCGPDHPDPSRQDGLKAPWSPHTCWLNPPYSKIAPWLEKAHREAQRGATVVALVPLDTSTQWWLTGTEKATKVILVTGGRIQFTPPPGVKASSNNRPSALLVFDGTQSPNGPEISSWNYPESLDSGKLPETLTAGA